MFDWVFGKDINKVINETKSVRVKGVRFTIKKVNVLNHLDGSHVMTMSYDTHKTKAGQQDLANASVNEQKIKKHFSEVLVAGVVSPKLCFKPEDGKTCVDDLFIDWEMVNELYMNIMSLTYGKKKVRQLISAASASLK